MFSPCASVPDVDRSVSEVLVRLPNSLAEFAAGRREVRIEVEGPVSLAEVLDLLTLVAPAVGRRVRDETGAIRRFVNVYVGDVECREIGGLAAVVESGTAVSIIPSVAGG